MVQPWLLPTRSHPLPQSFPGSSIRPATTPRAHAAGSGWFPGLLATVVILSSSSSSSALQESPPPDDTTLADVPQTLSGGGAERKRIQRPKSRQAETCTVKCLGTCIRGGTGEGPLNVRRPLIVFKSGFRSRNYCLVECSEICNLIKDGDDGP